jgi:hypothetical protein
VRVWWRQSWQHERWAIKELGTIQAAAGRFLRVSARQAGRMAEGETENTIVLVLYSMIHHGDTPVVPDGCQGRIEPVSEFTLSLTKTRNSSFGTLDRGTRTLGGEAVGVTLAGTQ